MPRILERVQVLSQVHTLSEDGVYWTAVNPTPGTGLATIAALASLSDTSPFIQVNSGAAPVFFDYLKLTATAPGTAGTAIRYAIKSDALKAAPTGGSQLTPTNAQIGLSTATPGFSVYAGALVAAAASAAKLHSHGLVRPVIPVIGDTYLFKFGAVDQGVGSMAPAGTAICNSYVGVPPMMLGPNKTMQFHIWLPSQSAASSYELELGLWER